MDPIAWQCASCGSPLHVPDAMTSTSPIKHGPPGKQIPAFSLGGKIFGILLVVGFFTLNIVLKEHLLPANDRHFESLLWVVLICIVGIGVWAIWYER